MSKLDARKNFAISNVSTGYLASDLSIVLATGDGSKFPDPAIYGAFNLVWWNYSDYKQPSDDPNVEVVRCTARTGDILTITRGQEGTSASDKNIGTIYKVINGVTAKMFDDIEEHLNNIELQSPFKSGLTLFKNPTYNGSGQITKIEYYTDDEMGTILFTEVITYSGYLPTVITITDEITGKVRTITNNYSGNTWIGATDVIA